MLSKIIKPISPSRRGPYRCGRINFRSTKSHDIKSRCFFIIHTNFSFHQVDMSSITCIHGENSLLPYHSDGLVHLDAFWWVLFGIMATEIEFIFGGLGPFGMVAQLEVNPAKTTVGHSPKKD